MSVYNSGGCIGRCDARCHFAHEEKCDCVCGGRYHGARGKAIEMHSQDLLALELIAEWNWRADQKGGDLRLDNNQPALFGAADRMGV